MSSVLSPGSHTIIVDLARVASSDYAEPPVELTQHELGYGTVLEYLQEELQRHCMMLTVQTPANSNAVLPAVLLVDWHGQCQWVIEPHSTLDHVDKLNLQGSIQNIARQSTIDSASGMSWEAVDCSILRQLHQHALEHTRSTTDRHHDQSRHPPIVWWLSSSLRCAAPFAAQATYLLEQLYRLGTQVRVIHVSDSMAAGSTDECDPEQATFTIEHVVGEQQNMKLLLAGARPVDQKAMKLVLGEAVNPDIASKHGRSTVTVNAALSPLSYPPLQLQAQQRCKAHELNTEPIDVNSITTIAQLDRLKAHVAVSCSQQKKGQVSRLTDMQPAVQYGPLRYTLKPGKRVATSSPEARDTASSDSWWHEVDALHVVELIEASNVTEAIQLMYAKPMLITAATGPDDHSHNLHALVDVLRSKQLALVAEARTCHDVMHMTQSKQLCLLVAATADTDSQHAAAALYLHPVASREMLAQAPAGTSTSMRSALNNFKQTAPAVAAEVQATLDTLPTLSRSLLSELSNGTAELLAIFQQQGRAIRTAL